MDLLRLDQVNDTPSRTRLLKLHPLVRQSAVDAYLAALASMSGKNMLRVTHSLRTFEYQNELYAKGRDKAGNRIGSIVTKAKGGQSYHNYGLALDFVLMHSDGKVSYSLKEDLDEDGVADWREVANAFKSEGWEWGGEWNKLKDNPHVQFIPPDIATEAKRRKMRPWAVLLEIHTHGKPDADGYIVL